jgi:hypothetical protein
MDFINQPNTTTRVKKEKVKQKTKYKVRGWVEDLMESPNRWAIYSRQPMTRQGMQNCHSSIDAYRKRYPHVEWAVSKEEEGYAVCGRYTPTEESQ